MNASIGAILGWSACSVVVVLYVKGEDVSDRAFLPIITGHLWDRNHLICHHQPPFQPQHFSHHQLVLNTLLSSVSVAVFMHHFSILQIYAIILLTDMALRLPGLSINHVFQSVWQTAAPFMSLTFPAGYWISKHTVVCIFCSSTIIKSYTWPSAPMTQPIRENTAL